MTHPTPARRPLRAMVVDDSDVSRAAIAAILRDAGHVVVAEARDGEEALPRALEVEPDVVVLDLQMPRIDGFTFLRLLMARRPTPVIVVSAWAGKRDVFKSLELGAIDFVAKPDGAGGLAAAREELVHKCAVVAGGRVIAESERSAIVYGMPQAAADAGAVDELVELGAVADRLVAFARQAAGR